MRCSPALTVVYLGALEAYSSFDVVPAEESSYYSDLFKGRSLPHALNAAHYQFESTILILMQWTSRWYVLVSCMANARKWSLQLSTRPWQSRYHAPSQDRQPVYQRLPHCHPLGEFAERCVVVVLAHVILTDFRELILDVVSFALVLSHTAVMSITWMSLH